MKMILTAFVSAAAIGLAGAAEKRWMCPQMEMELFRVHAMRDDVRRMGLYAGHPGQLPGTRDNVFFRRTCAKDAPLPETWGAVRSTRYDESEGFYIRVRGNGREADIRRMEDLGLQPDSRRGEIQGVRADARRRVGNRSEALIACEEIQ